MAGQYITLGGSGHSVNIWYDEKSDAVHLATGDPTFTEADGTRPGLRARFSANPRSADYNPGNYNRCVRALREAGKNAPATDAPEHQRHLQDRPGVIAALAAPDVDEAEENETLPSTPPE